MMYFVVTRFRFVKSFSMRLEVLVDYFEVMTFVEISSHDKSKFRRKFESKLKRGTTIHLFSMHMVSHL